VKKFVIKCKVLWVMCYEVVKCLITRNFRVMHDILLPITKSL